MSNDDNIARLMKIAEKPLKNPIKKDSVITETAQVNQFIIEHSIKSSEDLKILAVIIYDMYSRWCDTFQYRKLKIIKFNTLMKKFFKSTLKRDGLYFQVTPNGFDLSQQNLEFCINKWKRISNDSKKKTEKKRKD